jgi:hypothetical protein
VSQRVLITEYLQSRLGPDSDSAYEVTYYLWRRNRRRAPWFVTGRRRSAPGESDGGYTYEIWVVAILGRLKADGELSAESGSGPCTDLKEAVADVAAGRVTGTVWKIDDLSEGMAAGLIGMPEKLQGLVDGPLAAAAGAAGLPAPEAAISSDVADTLLLKPVMRPIGNVLHGLEILGAIAGVVTGLPGLSALCLKHLVHDKITGLIGKAFSRAISGADKAPDRQPPAAAAPEARGRLDEPAIASPQPGTSKVPSATAGREPSRPRRRGTVVRVQAAPGRLRTHEERLRAAAPTVSSEETAQLSHPGRSSYRRRAAAARRPMDTPSHDRSAESPLPPYPPKAAPPLSRAPNARDSRPGRNTGMSR